MGWGSRGAACHGNPRQITHNQKDIAELRHAFEIGSASGPHVGTTLPGSGE
jgi:hypothetical protein